VTFTNIGLHLMKADGRPLFVIFGVSKPIQTANLFPPFFSEDEDRAVLCPPSNLPKSPHVGPFIGAPVQLWTVHFRQRLLYISLKMWSVPPPA